jgi:hypothetical protein
VPPTVENFETIFNQLLILLLLLHEANKFEINKIEWLYIKFSYFFRFPKAPMRPFATFVARLAVNQSPITEEALTTAALKSRRKKIGKTFRGKRKSKRYILCSSLDYTLEAA